MVDIYTPAEVEVLEARNTVNKEIGDAIKKLHMALWEEIRAPLGVSYNKAIMARENAERNLRGKLAKYNPRDISSYNLE